MADWIKIKVGLEQSLKVLRIAGMVGTTAEVVICDLYRSASWFAAHGKHGKLQHPLSLLDHFLDRPGFSAALSAVGWAGMHGEVSVLKGFCTVSATRKALGHAVRQRVLGVGFCAACGATEKLVVDHKTPIVLGGSCEESNSQALCAPCNGAKGRKTMGEFMSGRQVS